MLFQYLKTNKTLVISVAILSICILILGYNVYKTRTKMLLVDKQIYSLLKGQLFLEKQLKRVTKKQSSSSLSSSPVVMSSSSPQPLFQKVSTKPKVHVNPPPPQSKIPSATVIITSTSSPSFPISKPLSPNEFKIEELSSESEKEEPTTYNLEVESDSEDEPFNDDILDLELSSELQELK